MWSSWMRGSLGCLWLLLSFVLLLAVRAATPGGGEYLEPRPLPTPIGAKNVLFIAVDDMRPMMNLAYNF
eukprot:COSAG02_NODE_42136_length_387_cov_1.065972_1_plen_68_part_01